MKKRILSLVLILSLLASAGLLSACGETEEKADSNLRQVSASSVDELLGAIGPNTVITLADGVYNLTDADAYGKTVNRYVYFEDMYDGPALIIDGVQNLTVQAAKNASVKINALPRYADVLTVKNSSNVTLSGLTLGHMEEPGACSGGVVYLQNTNNAVLKNCSLFGCGILGITAYDCMNITAESCSIYDCSQGAADINNCYDVRLVSCSVHDCGEDFSDALFRVSGTTGFALINSEVKNIKTGLLSAEQCMDVSILGNSFSGFNAASMFRCFACRPVLASCSFENINTEMWYDYTQAEREANVCVSPEGKELYKSDFLSMKRADCTYSGPSVIMNEAPSGGTPESPNKVVASTVDELLNAIADNTVIYLEPGTYDLSSASDYGYFRSGGATWISGYDGPGLQIKGVKGLSISARESGTVQITATPRYVDVFSFEDCENIEFSGITAGHSEAPGACGGGVLRFTSCNHVSIDGCHLYGCGILGIQAFQVYDMSVNSTEIYDCSYGGCSFYECRGILFTGCSIYDCAVPAISNYSCSDVFWDDVALPEGDINYLGASADDGKVTNGSISYRFPSYDETFERYVQGYGNIEIRPAEWEVSFPEADKCNAIHFKPGWLPFEVNPDYGGCLTDEAGWYTRLVSESTEYTRRPSYYRDMSQPFMIEVFYAPELSGGGLILQYATPGLIEFDQIGDYEVLMSSVINVSGTDNNHVIAYNPSLKCIIVISGEAPLVDLVSILQNLKIEQTDEIISASDYPTRYCTFDVAVG